MSIKDVQIFNHRHYKLIRNTCVVVILLAVFILPGVLQIQRLDRQTAKLDEQAQEIKELTGQVKDLSKRNVDLSQQNIALNQQNIRHTDCVAKIFAQYTKDFVPVTFNDLDNCSTYTSGSTSQGSVSSVSNPSKNPTSGNSSAPGQSTSPSQSSESFSSPNPTTPPQPAQPNRLQRILNSVKNIFN